MHIVLVLGYRNQLELACVCVTATCNLHLVPAKQLVCSIVVTYPYSHTSESSALVHITAVLLFGSCAIRVCYRGFTSCASVVVSVSSMCMHKSSFVLYI
jgi:hypothetical protein